MNFRSTVKEDLEINLIPMIDVLLVILIFLMVTTTYSKFAELQINLPSAQAEKQTERPNEINVTVNDGVSDSNPAASVCSSEPGTLLTWMSICGNGIEIPASRSAALMPTARSLFTMSHRSKALVQARSSNSSALS
ncbi:MAG: biopolymer transporter ExbD, partial [Gammaproteobacteria bacterium]|nr:biopolymer transporter ExbD [Gammaproteobacteria bacterium]